MTEWNDLVDAVKKEEWGTARTLAEAVKAEWQAVRGVVLAFTLPDADTEAQTVDAALDELQVVLQSRPVNPVQVEHAMANLSAFITDPDNREAPSA